MSDVRYLIDVPKNGLCHGCGGCSGACPTDAITMCPTPEGTLAPKIELDLCTNCGLCFSVCPGHAFDVPYFQKKIFDHFPTHPEVGNFLEIHAGYAADEKVQWAGQSGGVIAALLIDLLERGEIDGAVVTETPAHAPTKPVTFIARTREEVLRSVGSKYGPVSAAEAIKLIRHEKGKFVFVGVSCQIHAFLKASEFSKTLSKKIYAYFGLHCKGIYTTHFFDFLLHRYGVNPGDVKKFDLRSKEWRGWPCDLRIETHSGKIIDVPGSTSRVGPRDYFAQWRCLTCTDKLNEFSDISFGDCRVPWVYGKESLKSAERGMNPGQSDIVVRTARGKAILESALSRKVLVTQKMTWKDLVLSTKPAEKKLAIANLRYIATFFGLPVPNYGVKYRVKSDAGQKLFSRLHLFSFPSSLQFYFFHRVARFPWVRKFWELLPLRYIHLAGGVRRRLTNYRKFNMAELSAEYTPGEKPRIIPSSCHPLAGLSSKQKHQHTHHSDSILPI